MRSRALRIMYGSHVFLVVPTVMLPSIRSSWHDTPYSHTQRERGLHHHDIIGITNEVLECASDVGPDLLQVFLSVSREECCE